MGKSLLLKGLSYHKACNIDERSVALHSWIEIPWGTRDKKSLNLCHREPNWLKKIELSSIKQDYASAIFFDGSKRLNTSDMMSVPEFYKELLSFKEIQKILSNSSGEQTKVLLEGFLNFKVNKVIPFKEKSYSSYSRYEYKTFVQDTVSKGNSIKGTIILDEPETFLDMKSKIEFWKKIVKLSKKSQVIVATHCFLALNQEANFIELEKGYLDSLKDTF